MTFHFAEALWFLLLALLPALGVTAFLVAADVRRGHASIGTRGLSVLWWVTRLLAWTSPTLLAGFLLIAGKAWVDEGRLPTLPRLDFTTYPLGSAYTGGPHPSACDSARSIVFSLSIVSLIGIVPVSGLFVLLRAANRAAGVLSERVYYVSWTASVALVAVNPGEIVTWLVE